MNKSNLEQLLEKYAKGELSGAPYEKLLHWFGTMERYEVSGGKFALPDDERLYRLLISTKSTLEDIEAFRPYSYDPPSRFSNPWVQFCLSLAAIVAMIVTTSFLKG